MANRPVTVANFVLHFGKSKVLLDYLVEIAVPALLSPVEHKIGAKKRFVFLNTQLVKLSKGQPPVLGISGRLVNDTVLVRQQILSGGQLLQSHGELHSSPSAYFLLLLNTHRLIYWYETPNAPSLDAFEREVQWQLKRTHLMFIKSIQAQHKKQKKEYISLASIEKEHPRPALEVIALSANQTLAEFIQRYSKLQKVQINFVKPNDETDMSEVFKRLREEQEQVGAVTMELSFRANKEGLIQDEITESVASATMSGNAKVKFAGIDKQGNDLKGSNDDFKVSLAMDLSGLDDAEKPAKLLELYNEYVSNGTIRVASDVSSEFQSKLTDLAKEL